MAKFIYKMQNILNIKEQLETQEKQNFAMERAKLAEEEEKLRELNLRRKEIAENGRKLRLEKIDILSIKENTALSEYIDSEIKKQIVKVKAAEKSVESARTKMQNAISERKIHEKLKENAFENFMKEENMAEAKEIDELTSYTYGQKNN